MSDTLLMLLEMIEEALEEQSPKVQVAGSQQVFDLIKTNFPDLQNLENDSNRNRIKIKNTGDQAKRASIMKMLKVEYPELQVKDYRIATLKNGTIIELIKGATSATDYPPSKKSELFEGNLVAVLNGNSMGLEDRVNWMDKDYYKNVAMEVIEKTGLPTKPASEEKGPWKKLETVTADVTELYLYFNKKASSVPKTDITNGSLKVSVKKKGGTILSAEVGESRALVAVAYGFTSPNRLDEEKGSALINHLDVLARAMSKENWNDPNLDAAGRRDLGDAALTLLFRNSPSLKAPTMKIKILKEAITGDNRFKSEPARANTILVWDYEGNGSVTEIQDWADQNNGKLKLDIRWRGKDRSAGFRIDELNENFQNRMLALLGPDSPYPKEQNEQLQLRTMDRTSTPPLPPINTESRQADFFVLFKDIFFDAIANEKTKIPMSFEEAIDVFDAGENVDADG